MKLEINLFFKKLYNNYIQRDIVDLFWVKFLSNCGKRWKRKVDVCLFCLFVVVYGFVVLEPLCL